MTNPYEEFVKGMQETTEVVVLRSKAKRMQRILQWLLDNVDGLTNEMKAEIFYLIHFDTESK